MDYNALAAWTDYRRNTEVSEFQQEAMDLLQEECGEVIQAISKIRRFGPDFKKGKYFSDEEFEMECFDVLAILDLLDQSGFINYDRYEEYMDTIKREKLRKWTHLLDKEED